MADDQIEDFDPEAFAKFKTEQANKDYGFDPDAFAAFKKQNTGALGQVEAGVHGAISGATAGWAPELSGAEEASGIPTTIGGIQGHAARIGVGAARLAYEHLTGQHGPATEAYERERNRLQGRQETLKEVHPLTYGTAELAGTILPMAVAPEAEGVGLAARMGQGAKIGATYGAASGTHEGYEKEGLPGAVEGAITGGLEGAAGGAGGELVGTGIGKVLGKAYDIYGRPVVEALRDYREPVLGAARRAAGAFARDDANAAGLRMTQAEWDAARAAGEPVLNVDRGGEAARALLRSSANASPEARAIVDQAVQQRYRAQSERGGATVRGLITGGADRLATHDGLRAAYDAERVGAYARAYEAGDKPLGPNESSELGRLLTSPTVRGALRGAVNEWQDFQVGAGYGGMNPPVKITPDGQLQFLPGKGLLPYPNLQLWDYASRIIAGKTGEAVRAGNDTAAKRYGDLERDLKSELDRLVPEFRDARGVARQFFGGESVQEAGAKAFADTKSDPRLFQRAMAKMQPAERDMFREAYADAWARKLEGRGDNQDITLGLMNSLAERKKVEAIFGSNRFNKVQAFVNRERIYDAARKALGNSTTVRQMLEAGLVGSGAGWLMGDQHPLGEGLTAAGLRHFAPEAAKQGVRTALGYIDRRVALNVARMLTSDDPSEISKALQMAASNPAIGQRLAAIAHRLAMSTGARAGRGYLGLRSYLPDRPIDLLRGAPAQEQSQENQPAVPRPAGQTESGGRVDQQQPFHPTHIGARQAPDGHWYVRDANRDGKYLRVVPRASA